MSPSIFGASRASRRLSSAPFPCHRYRQAPVSRRQMLGQMANGFGALGLLGLMADSGDAVSPRPDSMHPNRPKVSHHSPKARSVIFLYMDGGPSQVDTFDYKPMLEKYHGQDPRQVIGKLAPTQFDNIGVVYRSPWKFRPFGQCGTLVSELFPHIARWVDELAVIKSMVSNFSEHTNANYFLHTGSGLQGRPSMGAWLGYGLGSENENLPAFVVINGGLIPPGGLDNFNSGFLPASYQGSIFRPAEQPVANILPQERTPALQQRKLALLDRLDELAMQNTGHHDAIEAAITNYELAARMQTAVPELMDVRDETQATRKLYGLDAEFANTRTFGMQCLVARRLVERGVRFIELTCPANNGDRWDQHSSLVDGHGKNSLSVDQPIAGLIADLRARGLLDETLLVWSGEFGRTPFAQGGDGRDHNPSAFSMWMCGGGVRGGTTYGTTDEWGYRVVDKKVEVHDIHATMLHLLGIDHERLTFRFSGRDIRLTDVYGEVIRDVVNS